MTETQHRLIEKNLITAFGKCVICGPVHLLRLNRGGACGVARGKLQQGSNKYPLNDGTIMYVTPKERVKLLNKFGLQCGICDVELDHTTARLDHDHESGQWRGVLCDEHNKAIGFFGDNSEGLRKALRYLELAEMR